MWSQVLAKNRDLPHIYVTEAETRQSELAMARQRFKFSERVAQKEASRQADADRLSSGSVSAYELMRENAFVKSKGFQSKKIGFSPKCRPSNGERYYRA